jgi:altronate dehydratase small subunit
MQKALVIDEKDTVAVMIESVKKGETVVFVLNNESREITAISDIKIYHKIAVQAMKKSEPVVKYGEHIGVAGTDIAVGEHVHEHNVESHRENLEEVVL